MVKLLVYYHPKASTAAEIENFVQQIVEECLRLDLGLMLEPLSYSIEAGGSLSSTEKRNVIAETVRRLVVPGVDILKAEFPLNVQSPEDEKSWPRPVRRSLLDARYPGSSFRLPWITIAIYAK